jgi:hypothetical protein
MCPWLDTPDGQRRKQSNGHREFHRHLSFDNVLEGFLEDGISADQSGGDADHTNVRERFPKAKPDGCSGQSNEDNPRNLQSRDRVPAIGITFWASGTAMNLVNGALVRSTVVGGAYGKAELM